MSAQPADVLPYCSISEAMGRVAHWWRVTRGGQYLGFASRSVLGRVIEEGCQGASHGSGVQPAPWMAPADEQVDKLIARMPPELRDAITLDQQRGLPMKACCAKLHCTPDQMRRWTANGYGWIAGSLTVADRSRQ